MSCFYCRYYTGLQILPCGVDPITAANSPELGCRDWEGGDPLEFDVFEDFEQLSDIHLVDPECLSSIELEALASRSMED